MSKVIIFAGMARSGTSLIANLLKEAGIDIGDKLAPSALMNPRGFFEDVEFSKFHWDMLIERGVTGLEKNFKFEPTAKDIERAQALIRTREKRAVWGWKDPQTTLFLDFWNASLPSAKFLFVYRHPLDVFMSYVRYMGYHNLNLIKAADNWSTSATKMMEFYHKHPQKCLICCTHSILDHLGKFVDLLQEKLELKIYVDSTTLHSFYHQKELGRLSLTSEINSVFRGIDPQLANLYEQIDSIADLPNVPYPSTEKSVTISNLHTFISTLTQPLNPIHMHGLFLLLLLFIDSELHKHFTGAHLKYLEEQKNHRVWLEQQCDNWQQTTKEQEKIIQELRTWVKDLQQGKAWIEEQWSNWQKVAAERETVIQEQQIWIKDLEKEKAWLEKQQSIWQKITKRKNTKGKN